MGSIPGLPDGVRTKLFRAIVQVLKADPVLSQIVERWWEWTSSPTDTGDIPVPEGGKVNMRLTPRMNTFAPWTPDSMTGWLAIKIEATIPGTNVDDYLNLQDAIENAIYKPNHKDSIALQVRFQQIMAPNSGATTGQIVFFAPVYDDTLPERTDNNFYVLGEMRIEIRKLMQR